jgi:hypothetical protein
MYGSSGSEYIVEEESASVPGLHKLCMRECNAAHTLKGHGVNFAQSCAMHTGNE